MKRLTPEQQREVERLYPYAMKIAKNFHATDDLYESVAAEALCEAVLSHDPARGELKQHVGTVVKTRLINLRRNEAQRRLRAYDGPPVAGPARVSTYELIERLPADVRDAVRARVAERMTPRQIAGYYGLSLKETEEKLKLGAELLQHMIDDLPP